MGEVIAIHENMTVAQLANALGRDEGKDNSIHYTSHVNLYPHWIIGMCKIVLETFYIHFSWALMSQL